MGERQRSHIIMSDTQTAGGIGGQSRVVLAGRARQLIRLRRYWGMMVSSELSASSTVHAVALITTGEVRVGAGTPPQLTELDPEMFAAIRNQSVIDAWSMSYSIVGTSGVVGIGQKEWDRETDLLVPQINVGLVFEPTDFTESLVLTFFAEYEWVDAEPWLIAAVNLVWGRDPQDFDLPGTQGFNP